MREDDTLAKAIRLRESAAVFGFKRIAGRHVANSGLISRRGYRRIFPQGGRERAEWNEDHAEQLAEVGREVFSGRNATIFEARVINPLLGLGKTSIDDLAAQFGITKRKVDKILQRCKKTVERAMAAKLRGQTPAKADLGFCPTCGFNYTTHWNRLTCKRGLTDWSLNYWGWMRNGLPAWDAHPDCLGPNHPPPDRSREEWIATINRIRGEVGPPPSPQNDVDRVHEDRAGGAMVRMAGLINLRAPIDLSQRYFLSAPLKSIFYGLKRQYELECRWLKLHRIRSR